MMQDGKLQAHVLMRSWLVVIHALVFKSCFLE